MVTSGQTGSLFGNILINGVGSYGLNVGKNVLVSGGVNEFLFGAKTNMETGWIPPVIISDNNFVEYPIISSANRYMFNQFDGQDLGTYHATFIPNEKSGIYSEGEKGFIGNDNTKYSINLPGLKFEQQLLEVKLSNIFSNSLAKDYTLNNFSWELGEKSENLTDGINTLFKIGNSYFGFIISGISSPWCICG